MPPLKIIYQDQLLVAINKPSGLLVHRSPIDRHETRFALQMLRDQLGQHVYPLHRLDKPTSGALLFALSPEIAKVVGQQFSEQLVKKTYLAIVRGFSPEQGVIDHALKEKLDDIADKDCRRDKPAQAAVTAFQRLATVELPVALDRYPTSRYSLMLLQPETGRKHQLRRHMKHISHPIIGDAKYGKSKHNHYFQQHLGSNRLLLSCTQLQLTHPASGKPLTINATPEESFNTVAERLGWSLKDLTS